MTSGIHVNIRRWELRCLLPVLAVCIMSCSRQWRSETSRPYPGIHLAETRMYRNEDHGSVIAVGIRRNGEIHIARQRINPNNLDGLMSGIAHSRGSSVSIIIGADVAAPFDAVWPVVRACRSNGMGYVSFAALNRGSSSMVTSMVWLPLWENDPSDQSAVIIREGACPTTLGITTNGFVLDGVSCDEPGLQAALEKLRDDEQLPETVLIVPDPHIPHGDFMTALLMCEELGLENIGLVEPDRLIPARRNEGHTTRPR